VNKYRVEILAVDRAGGRTFPSWYGSAENRKQAVRIAIAEAENLGWKEITPETVFLVQTLHVQGEAE